jgi:ankyrin repeat protein
MLFELFCTTYEQDGNTPLTSAALFGYTEIVNLLLDKGAKIEDATNVSNTIPTNFSYPWPSDHCCNPWKINSAYFILFDIMLFSPPIFIMNEQIGSTPLLSSMIYGHAETAELLLDRGANIENTDWVSNMMFGKYVITVLSQR